MKNLIIIVILAVILGFAAWYVYKSRKSGKKCIGCPHGATCSGKCCGCGSPMEEESD